MMNVGVSIFAASFLFLFFFVVKVVGVGVLKESKKKTGDGVEDDDKGKEVVAKCTHFLNFSNDVGKKVSTPILDTKKKTKKKKKKKGKENAPHRTRSRRLRRRRYRRAVSCHLLSDV